MLQAGSLIFPWRKGFDPYVFAIRALQKWEFDDVLPYHGRLQIEKKEHDLKHSWLADAELIALPLFDRFLDLSCSILDDIILYLEYREHPAIAHRIKEAVRNLVDKTERFQSGEYSNMTDGECDYSAMPVSDCVRDLVFLLQRAKYLVPYELPVEEHAINNLKLIQSDPHAEVKTDAPKAGEQVAPTKPKRGRPNDTDPKADQRIYDAWKTGEHKTYADLGRELSKTERQITLAIDRHKKRIARRTN